jgi:hypothetical protein
LDDVQRFLATKEGLPLIRAFRDIENDAVKRELVVLIGK